MTLNEASLELRFNKVSNSQESIQTLSYLCLHYKTHHRKIAQLWLKCLQKAKITHRLTLIYLANDIVQNARRKNASSFITDFKSILKDTIPYLRDSKIKSSVERVFSIWQDRAIYDATFVAEIKSMLNARNRDNPQQQTQPQSQPQQQLLSQLISQPPPQKNNNSNNDSLVECLNRITSIENSIELFKQNGTNSNAMSDLKLQMKEEIEERTKLSRLIDENLAKQKKLLKQSEDELANYKSQLEYVTKLRKEV